MKVKTYRAATMKQALEDIKKELGEDAFILGGREVKAKKMMGLFGKSHFEVTAAMDYSNSKEGPSQDSQSQETQRKLENHLALDRIQDTVQFSPQIAWKARPAMNLPMHQETRPASSSAKGNDDGQLSLRDEIRQLKSLIQSIPHQASPHRSASHKTARFSQPVCEEMFSSLIRKELDDDLAYELIDSSIKERKGTAALNTKQLTRRIASHLSRRIHIGEDLIKPSSFTGQRVVALVGPTGVGKTTTLAKLAARAVLEERLKVGFITLDTFRIAATEQLKTYAEIIDVPAKIVENINRLNRSIQEFADRDLILIDTAGRSPWEIESQSEVAGSLSQAKFICKTLVLSATTKASDLGDILEKYRIFDPSCLIFAKLDETRVYGPVINHLVRTGSPLAYLTTGQNVPKDIVHPNVADLVNLFQEADTSGWEGFIQNSFQPQPLSSKTPKKSFHPMAATSQSNEVIPAC